MYRIAKQVVNRNVETKTSQQSSTDGLEIFHNNFVWLTGNLLKTEQGIGEQESGIGDRIGDKIKLTGINLKFMLELNERYSDVTFRILVIRSARGDVPDRTTLFNGESGNKMMDSLNKERYTIVAQKFVKLRAPNMSVPDPTEATGTGSGIVYEGAGHVDMALSRATRIVKIWIPGSKFAKGGFIQYENGGTRQRFFDYHVACYAYSNYSTLQDVYYVGRVNEFLSKMYYKDA